MARRLEAERPDAGDAGARKSSRRRAGRSPSFQGEREPGPLGEEGCSRLFVISRSEDDPRQQIDRRFETAIEA